MGVHLHHSCVHGYEGFRALQHPCRHPRRRWRRPKVSEVTAEPPLWTWTIVQGVMAQEMARSRSGVHNTLFRWAGRACRCRRERAQRVGLVASK